MQYAGRLEENERRLLARLAGRGGRTENAVGLGVTLAAYDGRRKRLVEKLRELAFDVPRHARPSDWEAIGAEVLGSPSSWPTWYTSNPANRLGYQPEDTAIIDRAIDAISKGEHIPFDSNISHAVSRRISDSLTHDQLVSTLRQAATAENLHQAKWPIHLASGALDAAQRRWQRGAQSPDASDRNAAKEEWAEICEPARAALTRWTRHLTDSKAAPDTTLTELGELEAFLDGGTQPGETMDRALKTLAEDPEYAYRRSMWAVHSYYRGAAAALLRAYAHLGRENLGVTYKAIEVLTMTSYWRHIEEASIPISKILTDYEQIATSVAIEAVADSLEDRRLRIHFERSLGPLRAALLDDDY